MFPGAISDTGSKNLSVFVTVYLAIVLFRGTATVWNVTFDAINHAFSVVSTGGFSTRNLHCGL